MRKEDVVLGRKYVVTGYDGDYSIDEVLTITEQYEQNSDWFKPKEKGIIIECSNFEPYYKELKVGDHVLINVSDDEDYFYGKASFFKKGLEGVVVSLSNLSISVRFEGHTCYYSFKREELIKKEEEKKMLEIKSREIVFGETVVEGQGYEWIIVGATSGESWDADDYVLLLERKDCEGNIRHATTRFGSVEFEKSFEEKLDEFLKPLYVAGRCPESSYTDCSLTCAECKKQALIKFVKENKEEF